MPNTEKLVVSYSNRTLKRFNAGSNGAKESESQMVYNGRQEGINKFVVLAQPNSAGNEKLVVYHKSGVISTLNAQTGEREENEIHTNYKSNSVSPLI